jgi:hypothetical protein
MSSRQSQENRGVIFVAVGEAHVAAARTAARSVRQSCRELPIDLFTDVPDSAGNEFSVVIKLDEAHPRSKVDCLSRTRFERTLYLDNDVRVISDISHLFGVLDRFDVALAHAALRNTPKADARWRIDLPKSFPQFNSGVFLYRRNEPVLRFMRTWAEAFREFGSKRDQATLRELLWLSDLRIHTLPPEYNLRDPKYESIWSADEAIPEILHYYEFHHPTEPGARPASETSLAAVARRIAVLARRRIFGSYPQAKQTAGLR